MQLEHGKKYVLKNGEIATACTVYKPNSQYVGWVLWADTWTLPQVYRDNGCAVGARFANMDVAHEYVEVPTPPEGYRLIDTAAQGIYLGEGDLYWDVETQTWESTTSGSWVTFFQYIARKLERPKYYILNKGEVLQEGDEVLTVETDLWTPTRFARGVIGEGRSGKVYRRCINRVEAGLE